MRRRLDEARVARLATVDAKGRPHLVPITFVLDDETVYTAVDEKPKRTRRLQRLENVRVHPTATVLVDHYEEEWGRLWWVRVRGPAEVLEAGPGHRRALARLVEKYPQYRTSPPAGPVIAVTAEEWTGWSAGP